jgi:cytochrome P450
MSSLETPLVKFDSTDQSLPFHDLEIFTQVREAGGIAWTEEQGGLWVVGTHELCKLVAQDHTRFISGKGIRHPRGGHPQIFALEYDGDKHTVHRRILNDLTGPRATKAHEPLVRAHARRLAAAVTDGGSGDLGADFAYKLPLDVIFALVGAPDDIKPEAVRLAESLVAYARPMPDGSDPAARLNEIFDDLIANYTPPPGSWLATLKQLMNGGEHELDELEVRGALTALLLGGHHSTVRALSCLVSHIVRDPQLQRDLRDEPSRIPAIAEESMRLDTPLRWFMRTATEDVVVGGQQIHAGERVYLLYGSANRDPAQFESPEEFHSEGTKNTAHLAFGWGRHRCAGMPLAQLELRVGVEELFAATEWITLSGDIEWLSLVDPYHMPCTFTRPAAGR